MKENPKAAKLFRKIHNAFDTMNSDSLHIILRSGGTAFTKDVVERFGVPVFNVIGDDEFKRLRVLFKDLRNTINHPVRTEKSGEYRKFLRFKCKNY